MNKQIRELAIIANPSSKEIYEADNWQYNCAAWDSNNLEKFAKLIVQECANELIKWKDEPFPYDPEFGARLIKQNFGVEE